MCVGIYMAFVIAISVPFIANVRGVAKRSSIQIVKLHDAISSNLNQKNLVLSYLPLN